MHIVYAGYGCYSKTADVTRKVTEIYRAGNKTIKASNDLVPSDPCPGERKYLYVVFQQKPGFEFHSAVTGENDTLTLP